MTSVLKKQQHEALSAHLAENLWILAFSLLAAFFLAKSGILEALLTQTRQLEIIGSFIAGLFFTSLFTVAPATVALAEIAQANSLWIVALFGGLGAVIGDLALFRFLKSHLSDELFYLFTHTKSKRLTKIFHLKIFHWLLVFLGALVIASPLPDELGLTMMGITKIKARYLMPISFVLNTLGIVAVGLIARQLN